MQYNASSLGLGSMQYLWVKYYRKHLMHLNTFCSKKSSLKAASDLQTIFNLVKLSLFCSCCINNGYTQDFWWLIFGTKSVVNFVYFFTIWLFFLQLAFSQRTSYLHGSNFSVILYRFIKIVQKNFQLELNSYLISAVSKKLCWLVNHVHNNYYYAHVSVNKTIPNTRSKHWHTDFSITRLIDFAHERYIQ